MASTLSRDQFYILLSVLCAIFLAALDQTIVATAAPAIVNDLGGFEAMPWIFSAYMLASTVMIPIYGRFSDMYGRKLFYLSGIIVFLVGSILSGLAFNMPWLIASRALQGFGAGAIMVESFTIIGDLFVPAERGKWQGLISSMFGLASIAGPLLGGFLSEFLNWRWVFFINLPVGLLALWLTRIHFPKILKKGLNQPISYVNAAMLALGLLSFLVALLRIEQHHRWISWDIALIFTLSFILLITFVLRDRRTTEPIFPPELFRNRIFVLSISAMFFTAIGFYGAISYIPLFTQIVLRESAIQSGIILMPFVIATTLASASSGQIVSRTGKYKSVLIVSAAITIWGFYLLSKMDTHTTREQLGSHMVMIGVGIGAIMPIFIVIVQSSFGHGRLGVVTSSVQLFRNIGATMGTAILGTIINEHVSKNLSKLDSLDPKFENDNTSMLNEVIQQLLNQNADQQLLRGLRESFAVAITNVFLISAFLSLLVLLLVLIMPIITLRKTRTP